MTVHSRLFSPGVIGGLEMRNRVVLPSMTTRLAGDDGRVTPELTSYYSERAQGGCGLVIVEMASPQFRGRHRLRELSIYADEYVDGLRSLTAAIHAHGARAGIQLGHGGARALPVELGGQPIAALPGPVPVFEAGRYVNFPEMFDAQAFEALIDDHVSAARRAEAAGFDLVELHGAHGYLLTQLSHADENLVLSTASDRYRYLAELVRRVVVAVDIPVTYRVNGQDFYADGHTLTDTVDLVQQIVSSGVSAVSVSGGHYLSNDPEIMIPPMPYDDGVFLADAGAVKAAVKVPVIAAGRLNSPAAAEDALASGMADFIAIGRGQIADPHWARKVQTGASVRECIACNHCVRAMRSGATLACSVNPTVTTTGRPVTARPERRLIYGSGPAGLTYAVESARAGHEVCVVARDREWRAVSAPTFNGYRPDRGRMSGYFTSLWKECLDHGVHIVSEEDLTADWPEDADVVVDARGARYRLPGVPLTMRLAGIVPGRLTRAVSRRLHSAFLYRLRVPQDPSGLAVGGQRVLQIGDAARPGDLAGAVRHAYELAWKDESLAA